MNNITNHAGTSGRIGRLALCVIVFGAVGCGAARSEATDDLQAAQVAAGGGNACYVELQEGEADLYHTWSPTMLDPTTFVGPPPLPPLPAPQRYARVVDSSATTQAGCFNWLTPASANGAAVTNGSYVRALVGMAMTYTNQPGIIIQTRNAGAARFQALPTDAGTIPSLRKVTACEVSFTTAAGNVVSPIEIALSLTQGNLGTMNQKQAQSYAMIGVNDAPVDAWLRVRHDLDPETWESVPALLPDGGAAANPARLRDCYTVVTAVPATAQSN